MRKPPRSKTGLREIWISRTGLAITIRRTIRPITARYVSAWKTCSQMIVGSKTAEMARMAMTPTG